MISHPHTRRAFLGGTAAIFASAVVSRTASAAGARDPRLIVVILRGALDGLSLLAPVGDPAYGAVRGALALPSSGPQPGLPLDGFFLLNPRMPLTAGLYRKGEALLLHAVATPYRSRSHFDGQDVLESGLPDVGLRRSGWLNRLVAALPERTLARQPIGFAAGAQVPLIMRGNAPVLSWMPPAFPSGSMETKLRILDIYRHTDPKLAEILAAGLSLDERMGGEAVEGEAPGMAAKGPANIRQARAAAIAAGKLVAAPDGPRIGVLDVNGFDTHANQKPVEGVLGNLLAGIDAIVGGFEETLAPVWKDTAIVFVTEFGRTVAINGSAGTDHGTATAALLVGGAVKGGRVVADWPGLRQADLLDGRDLRPTLDLRGVLKGLAAEHLGLARAALDTTVFPESAAVRPLAGLIR